MSRVPSKRLRRSGARLTRLRLTLKGVREGNGLAKSVIYGDEHSQEVMQNLDAMSSDLRQITADLRAGKGTLGALLVDPSVYEDIKLVLGNVGRNKALRALVRYSIQRDEKVRGVEVRDPQPARPATRARAACRTGSGQSKNGQRGALVALPRSLGSGLQAPAFGPRSGAEGIGNCAYRATGSGESPRSPEPGAQNPSN